MISMTEKEIAAIENDIIEEFELFDEWSEKYEYIIELGQKLKELDPQHKIDSNKIKGCQSNVWLHAYVKDNRIIFEADSDSTFVKGEIALLIRVLSGQKAADIVDADLAFIDKIGLRQHLAMTRANGLSAMIKQMKFYALGYQSQGKS